MTRPTRYAAHRAVPMPSDDEYREVAGIGYEERETLHVMKMLAGTKDMYPAAVGLIKAVFSAEGVDPKVRQMIILRTAKRLDAPYEWQANETLSRNNGLSEEEMEAAASDGPVTGIAPEYVLACGAVDEASQAGTLSDPTLQALLDRYGATTTRKIVLIIGWFSLLSIFLNGCRVPLETMDKIGTKRSPLG